MLMREKGVPTMVLIGTSNGIPHNEPVRKRDRYGACRKCGKKTKATLCGSCLEPGMCRSFKKAS